MTIYASTIMDATRGIKSEIEKVSDELRTANMIAYLKVAPDTNTQTTLRAHIEVRLGLT